MSNQPSTAELVQEDLTHLLHPMTPLYEHAQRGPLVLVEGQGIMVRDSDGREYLDGLAGLWNVNVGHGRREIVAAAAAQMERLAFAPSFFGLSNVPAIQLGHRLAELTPPGLKRFFYTCGGSESNETAFKIARAYWRLRGRPEKYKIIARERAYHGPSYGALSATGLPQFHQYYGPLVPGFLHVMMPDPYRGTYDPARYADVGEAAAAALEEAIQREGPETVAAFIAEPVPGVGGVLVPPPSYFPRVQEICRRYQVLLIVDEVITGFGRTGRWFGVEHWGVQPDLMTLAKGITSGYLPLGAVALTEEIYQVLAAPGVTFLHGFTYYGHPVCCAAALANLAVIERERLVENAARMGEYLLARLTELRDHPLVGDVRGLGLMAGVELVADRATRRPFPPEKQVGRQVVHLARENGLLCRASGDIICFAPPLCIDRAGVDLLVGRFRRALETVAARV